MEIKTATALVHQVPIKVTIECPHCDETISLSYTGFCEALGGFEPPDWRDRDIECPHCKKTIKIDDQDWN